MASGQIFGKMDTQNYLMYHSTHFKLDDCRVWMRLHFWACRDSGLFHNAEFENFYTRLIGHFVAVYERTAVLFARESAHWSLGEGDGGRSIAGVAAGIDNARIRVAHEGVWECAFCRRFGLSS